MYCSKCGSEVPENSSFCGTCGQQLAAPVVRNSTADNQAPINKRQKAVYTREQTGHSLLVAIILCLVTLGVWLIPCLYWTLSSNSNFRVGTLLDLLIFISLPQNYFILIYS